MKHRFTMPKEANAFALAKTRLRLRHRVKRREQQNPTVAIRVSSVAFDSFFAISIGHGSNTDETQIYNAEGGECVCPSQDTPTPTASG